MRTFFSAKQKAIYEMKIAIMIIWHTIVFLPDQTFNQLLFSSRSVLDILSRVRSVTLGNTVILPHLNSLKQDKSLNSKFT
jgi:hypothetical protein